jgi:hypothetical protein
MILLQELVGYVLRNSCIRNMFCVQWAQKCLKHLENMHFSATENTCSERMCEMRYMELQDRSSEYKVTGRTETVEATDVK